MEQPQSHFSATPDTHSELTSPVSGTRPALPIVALSEDPALIEAATTAAVEWCPVITSPSADRFVDQLVASGAELALIDAAVSPGSLVEFLDSMHRQFPHLQMLVAGPATVQHLIAPQLADGTVFRFAHKPASAARLKLFVDAALRKRQARITEQILATPLATPASARPKRSTDSHRPSGSGLRAWMLSAAIVAVLLIAVTASFVWYSSRPKHLAEVLPVTNSSPEVAAEAPASRPASPSVAEQRDAEQDGIDRAAAERSGRCERERLAAESQAHTAAISAEQMRRGAEVVLNQTAVEPDSFDTVQFAQSSASRAVATIPNEPTPTPMSTESTPVAAPVVLPVGEKATVSAPIIRSTGRAVQAIDGVIDEFKLHRLHFVAPVYPDDAQIHDVSGAVEMDFTVTADGNVKDINVTASEPRGVFDRSSVFALAHSRYEPVQRDGVAVEQRAHVRLRFAL